MKFLNHHLGRFWFGKGTGIIVHCNQHPVSQLLTLTSHCEPGLASLPSWRVSDLPRTPHQNVPSWQVETGIGKWLQVGFLLLCIFRAAGGQAFSLSNWGRAFQPSGNDALPAVHTSCLTPFAFHSHFQSSVFDLSLSPPHPHPCARTSILFSISPSSLSFRYRVWDKLHRLCLLLLWTRKGTGEGSFKSSDPLGPCPKPIPLQGHRATAWRCSYPEGWNELISNRN